MKYNQQAFDAEVAAYEKKLPKLKGKIIFIEGTIHRGAFFSIAPLSCAIHNLGGDVHVSFTTTKIGAQAIKDVWNCYASLQMGKKSAKTNALQTFISLVDKKTKGKFSGLFLPPDITLKVTDSGFSGSLTLPFATSWFVPYREADLRATCSAVWKNVFALKKERVNISFETIPRKKEMTLPLEDYLDSYAMCWHMADVAKKTARSISMGAGSNRTSMLAPLERISDLSATLFGCELEKNINEPVFVAYKKVSSLLNLQRIKPTTATFAVYGSGYGGKHLFGDAIGYPTKNRKSRWNSAGMMVYKFDWYPQTEDEERPPIARIGFTETIPLDIFIKTCQIDYQTMRARNQKLYEIMYGCDHVRVIGKRIGKYQSDFTVHLKKPDGTFREPRRADSDCRFIVDQRHYKKTGQKVGMMANIPSGECFITPEYLEGTIVGDVVMTVEESHPINPTMPVVVTATKKGYTLHSDDKKLLTKFENHKKECWKLLKEQKKSKNIPSKITELEMKNFNRIGEFAINTNPHAELCRYLIVNEKIANMIHIALGSGFDPDTSTNYHSDIVIDAPRQSMDIYAVKGKKKYWLLKEGKLLI